MGKFEKELERLVNDRYTDHEETKKEIDKWSRGIENDLNQIAKHALEFEKKFANMEKWLDGKHYEFEKRFEK